MACKSCEKDEWYFNRWAWIDDKGDPNHMEIKYCPLCGEKLQKEKCTACNSSGWYDACDKKGRPVKCGACDGTGYSD